MMIFQSNECPICYDNYTHEYKPVSLSCGHIFCSDCVRELVRSGSCVCPVDRKRFSASEIRPIFNFIEAPHDLQTAAHQLARLERKKSELESRNQVLEEENINHEEAEEAAEDREAELEEEIRQLRNQLQQIQNIFKK